MATINVRIDDDIKNRAEMILKELGLSASSAINMYYRQIIREKALPFKPTLYEELDYSKLNSTTRKAIEEGERLAVDANAKSYTSFQEMMKDIEDEEI